MKEQKVDFAIGQGKTSPNNYYRAGDYQMPPMQGWQCPICCRIMSPTTPYCPCNGRGWETTTTTRTSVHFPDYNRTYSAKDADGDYIKNLCRADMRGEEHENTND